MENNCQKISLKDASKMTPYSSDYLGLLVRKGKLEGFKEGAKWYTTKKAVNEYLNRIAEANYEHQEDLNVKVPAIENKKNLLNLRWAIALCLIVLIGVAIIGLEARRNTPSEYRVEKDQNNNLFIYVEDINAVNSVSVLPKE